MLGMGHGNVLRIIWQRAGRGAGGAARLGAARLGLAASLAGWTDRAGDQEQVDVSAGHEHQRSRNHAASLSPSRERCQPPGGVGGRWWAFAGVGGWWCVLFCWGWWPGGGSVLFCLGWVVGGGLCGGRRLGGASCCAGMGGRWWVLLCWARWPAVGTCRGWRAAWS